MVQPVAVVTGGARGIGRAVAFALAARGYRVAVCDIAAAVELPVGADYFAFDLGDAESHGELITRIVGRFGRMDCIVHNAAVAAAAREDLLRLTAEEFDALLRVNLRGTIFFSIAAANWMRANPPPDDAPRSQIFITSVSAEMASPTRAEYCVGKAGLSMWCKNLALRLAAESVQVFELRPGIIRTDMTAPRADEYDARIADGLVPAGRWGEAEDVAGVAARLAGGGFAFASGSVVNCDGGLAIARL